MIKVFDKQIALINIQSFSDGLQICFIFLKLRILIIPLTKQYNLRNKILNKPSRFNVNDH